MSSQPVKWYYSRDLQNIVGSNGNRITTESLLPHATLGQKFRVNLQVFSSGTTKYTGFDSGIGFNILADNDFDNPPPVLPLYGDGSGSWNLSSNSESGIDEYYYVAEKISEKPQLVKINGSEVTEGTLGSLGEDEWAWGDNDSIGYNTIYVRLSGSEPDPDSKADGYVKQQPPGTGTQPFINVDQDTINEADSWYDTDTDSFRNPDVTNGEISFVVNANTTMFYERLGSSSKASVNFDVQILDNSGEFQELMSFLFIAKRRRLASAENLEIELYPYFSRAESDARYLLEINNLNDLASKSTARANLGVKIGTDVQEHDENLDELATSLTASNPYLALYDEDCNASALPSGVELQAKATDLGDGTEDVDAYLKQRINGTLVALLYADADGNIKLGDGTRTVKLDGLVDAGGQRIKNAANPSNPQDLTTRSWVKGYVDSFDPQENILAFTDVASVSSPTEGDRYIDNGGGTGFTIDNIYTYRNSSWVETVADYGMRVVNKADGLRYFYNNSNWVKDPTGDHGSMAGLPDDDHPQYLKTDGSRTLTGNQDCGDKKLQNVAHATDNTDAATPRMICLNAPQSTITDGGALSLKRWTLNTGDSLRIYRGGVTDSTGATPSGLEIRLNNHTDGTQTTLIDTDEQDPSLSDIVVGGDDISIEIYNGTGGSIDAIGDINIAVV